MQNNKMKNNNKMKLNDVGEDVRPRYGIEIIGYRAFKFRQLARQIVEGALASNTICYGYMVTN